VVQVLTPLVTVAEGSFQASVQVRAASNATGSAVIIASNVGFAPDTTQISVNAGIDIVQSFSQFEDTESDEIFFNLRSGGGLFPAPAGGVSVVMTSSDVNCVIVTSPVNMAEGDRFGSAALNYGGGAALPCTTTVTANGGLFGTDSIEVTVSQVPDIGTLTVSDNWWGDSRLGSETQVPYRVTLSNASHGGVTVQVSSSNLGAAMVSNNAIVAGAPVTELFVPDGTSFVDFTVQGSGGATGNTTITARSAQFTTGSQSVDVVTSVMRILSVTASTTSLTVDDPIWAETGYIHANGVTFRYANASAFAGPVNATFNSSDAGVGQLVTTITSGATANAVVPVNSRFTPTSVAAGGVAIDPGVAGSATIFVTAPGFDAGYAGSSAVVNVTQPGMTLADIWWGDFRVGEGQQIPYRLTLGASNHGGVTVNVTIDSGDALLTTDAAVTGSNAISLFIPNGQTIADFTVQGVNAASGITITATQALFSGATAPLDVVPAVLQVSDLAATNLTLGSDDPFRARSGYVHSNGVTFRYAVVSAAAGDLIATLSSDDVSIGQLVTSSGTGATATVQIPVGQNLSPSTVATGGVALDPTGGAGIVNVSASAPGYSSYAGSTFAVTISPPITTMSMTDIWWGDFRVGEGQQIPYRLTLSTPLHSGATVDLTVDSADALLSTDGASAGSNAISVSIPAGQTIADFVVQGVNAAAVTITATEATTFSPATAPLDVVPAVLQVRDLAATNNTLGADDPFRARTGYIHSNGVTFRYASVSAAAGNLTATLSSDDVSVGQLITAGSSGGSVTVQIPVGQNLSPNTVATGGVALNPAGEGAVDVSASAAGYTTYTGSIFTVTISQPSLSMADIWWGDHRIGGGLQAPYRVTLGASQHGGVTVRVASGDTFRILLASNATTAGTSFIDLFIPNGSTTADFYVQGINGVTGNVTLTATTPLFPIATRDVELVQGVIDIINNPASIAAGAADDPFQVRTGYVHSNGVSFRWAPVSAGDAPLQVLVSSSDTSVAEVQTLNENGVSATVEVQTNQTDSASAVASGGIALDPVAPGTVSISTEVIGFNNSWPDSAVSVTVTP